MIHLNEDLLMKYVLELLDDNEENKLKEHLAVCDQCRKDYESVKGDIELIGGIDPGVKPEIMPLPKIKLKTAAQWIKAAAILLIGFFTGYLTTNFTHPVKVNVIKQNLIAKSISYPAENFSICEMVDMDVVYYQE